MLDPRLSYLLNRLFGRDTHLHFDHQAAAVRELCPPRKAVRPPAIMLPGQASRARATTPSTTMDIQMAIALGGEFIHPATRIYTIRDARIEQTALYLGGRRKSFAGVGVAAEMKSSFKVGVERVSRGLLMSTHQGLTYFGDWLFENTSRALLAEELGERALSMMRADEYSHARPYENIFQLEFTKLQRAQVEELLVVDDWGHPPEKAERYKTLRERARSLPGRQSGHDVFVLRGSSGQLRSLANEAACVDWARQRGFTIVDPAQMTVEELIRECRDARCVLGVEGSGLLHGLLAMSSSGFLLGIVAADRFVVSSKEYADAVGIPMALVVADKGELHHFEVDIRELEQTYELALTCL